MNKFRILFSTILCVSLLAFAGCGNNTNRNDVTDGTVNEETTDMYDNNVNDNGMNNGTDTTDSITNDMADDAKRAIDDVENAVDGNDGMSNMDNINDGVKDTKNKINQ